MGPCDGTSLRALLETLEDPAASLGALTDALLTLTNRVTEDEEDEEEGRELADEIEKCFPQLYKIFMTYAPSENAELSSAALQALGHCVVNPKISSWLCEREIHELLSTLNNVALNSGDKHTCTRALWVISKQSFPPDTVRKFVPSIIAMLETVLERDLHSTVIEYEVLNVIIQLIKQAPSDMGQQAVKWAKIIIPLVVHSAHKVQLRAASALEMGLPLLQQHQEVIRVTEQIMATKVIPELQKLFFSKHEAYILKLWPLFVKLLGKTLHHSGSFINSLLHLEELGFRSGSPVVKKIAFIAWKSLIDNFALNPDILCSAKRLRLLMQPLTSIHVRTESLALTKLEVWWYLLIRLGSQLPVHFEQVGIPLIQNTLCLDASQLQGNSSRFMSNQSLAIPSCSQKPGVFPFGTLASPWMTRNTSIGGAAVISSIQILGIEMLLHFFKGQEVLTFAKENNIVLSLEPLQYPVITSLSFFCKHASVFISAVQDGFINIGKQISDCMLTAIWKELVGFVKAAIEPGKKRERPNSEVLTMLLQTLKNIIMSKELPVLNSLSLLEVAIKELPPNVLGSPAYLIADMDLMNGTPGLFLLQLLFLEDLLEYGVQSQSFFLNYESLVESGFSGPLSPLSFTESVITIMSQSAVFLENKNYLWRMWSVIVNPLIEWIKKTNDVNQGDALEHNFNAIYSALLLPINCIFSSEFPQSTTKILLRSWSELYKAFARSALLVPTAEDNVCCDDLCAKIISGLEDEAHLNQSKLDALCYITEIMVECINFAPYDKKYQPTNRSPQTPVDWAKKKKDPLGKLSSFIKLLTILTNSLQRLAAEQSAFEELAPVGFVIVGVLQSIIGHISLPSVIQSVFGCIAKPLAGLYEKITSANPSGMSYGLDSKCEKLLADSLTCVQSNYTGSYNSELLEELSPLLTVMFLNKNKQIRSHAAQFWNATFGKAVTLIYPEELKSVLYIAKQKFILLLPAFENCEIMEGCSTAYSDCTENSQWDANISGMTVNPNGKRDCFLAQINEPEEESVNFHTAPKKIKLEFSGSKSNPKKIPLDEENTMDFVCIPLETKERVLTEHQKEVLRTKRDDIPVMYNNLDKSQDAILFSQDTEQQEGSLEKPIIVDMKEEHEEKEDKLTAQKKEARSHQLFIPHAVTGHYKSNVSQEKSISPVTKQANALKKEKLDQKNEDLDVGIPLQSTSDSTLNEKSPNSSSNSSASSDIISATPQVVVNRRQAFVTLEKFDDFDNGPFGPSVFSNISVTLTSPFIQKESMIVSDVSPKGKPDLENKSGFIQKESTVVSDVSPKGKPDLENKSGFIQKESTVVSDVSPKGKPDLENKSGLKLRARKTVTSTKRSRSEILNALEMCVKAKRSKEENTTEPKLESIDTIEIKKSSLAQNKTSEDKASEQMQSDQEEKNRISDTHCEDKHELSVDTQAVEHLLDNQSQNLEESSHDAPVEKLKVFPRYHTRRAVSQGLLTNLEKSESDSGETREEGAKRKSFGKLRKYDSPGNQVKEEPESQELSSQAAVEIQTRSVRKQKMPPGRETEMPSMCSNTKEIGTKEDKSSLPLSPSVDLKENAGPSHPRGSSDTGRRKPANRRESTSESILENRQEPSTLDTRSVVPDNPSAVSEDNAASTVSAFSSPKTFLDLSECQHKRSKRARKSRSCECCDEKLSPQVEKLSPEPKKASTPEPKLKEQKKVLSKVSVALTLIPNAEENHLAERLSTVPCATSTPLPIVEDSADVKEASTVSEYVSGIPRDSVPNAEPKKLAWVQTQCDQPVAGILDLPSSETISESSSVNSHSEDVSAQDHFSEPSSVDSHSEEVSPQDEYSEPGSVDSHSEVSPQDEYSEPSSVDSHSEELRAQDQDLESASKDSHLEELSAQDQDLESASKDSHLEDVSAQDQDLEPDVEAEDVMKCSSNQNGQVESKTDTEFKIIQTMGTEPHEKVVQNTVGETRVTSAIEVAELQENEMNEEGAEDNAAYAPSELPTLVLDSPPKFKEIDILSLAKVTGSPGTQTRCLWSPTASPSTSILKRVIKTELDSSSPPNKNRRVSFANPIYKEELADNIDRRSPVLKIHPYNNGSQCLRNVKSSRSDQAKLITTPTKGSLPPGTRSHKYKSSKKCLITEMVTEPTTAPTESVYPALVGCKASVDIILPQITPNTWTRGLGHLIRAKNIRTVGDLSSLTRAQIKTLPIRSPRVLNVRKVLKGYHEQQVKSGGMEQKDKTSSSTNENAVIADVCETEVSTTDESSGIDPWTLVNLLVDKTSSETLSNYSGNEIIEMQKKLCSVSDCMINSLQSRYELL